MNEQDRPKMTIWLDEKPQLLELAKADPAKFKEVMQTFVQLAEEAVENGWHKLPEQFGQGKIKLSFADLVKGILHGAMDLPEINPELYSVMGVEVHPLSMLAPRKDFRTGELRYMDWRSWYQLDSEATSYVSQEDIATIFRKLLRYYKYVSVDTLGKAMVNNQLANWQMTQNPNLVANLPFVPALRYQERVLGKLAMGKFFDNVGWLDCGVWKDEDSNECPACQHESIRHVSPYHLCTDCNAGFREAETGT